MTSTVAIPANETMPEVDPGRQVVDELGGRLLRGGQPGRVHVGGLHRQRHVDRQHHRRPVARHLGVGGGAGQRDGQQRTARPARRGRQVPPAARAVAARPSPAARDWRTAWCAGGGGAAAAGSRRPARRRRRARSQQGWAKFTRPPPRAIRTERRAAPSSRACGRSRTASRRRPSRGRCAAPGARHPHRRSADGDLVAVPGGGRGERRAQLRRWSDLLGAAGLRVEQGDQADGGQLQRRAGRGPRRRAGRAGRTAPAATVPSRARR